MFCCVIWPQVDEVLYNMLYEMIPAEQTVSDLLRRMTTKQLPSAEAQRLLDMSYTLTMTPCTLIHKGGNPVLGRTRGSLRHMHLMSLRLP